MANVATEGQFRLEGKDEYPHTPDASINFNESGLYQCLRHSVPHGRLDAYRQPGE